jgi:GNAT superfamily N-acetyltransferase
LYSAHLRYNPDVLYAIDDSELDGVLDAVVGRGSPVRFNLASFARVSHPEIPKPTVLTDSPNNPVAVLLLGNDWATGFSRYDAVWMPVFRSLMMGEGELPRGFPSPGPWLGGTESMANVESRPYIFLNQAPTAMVAGAIAAGLLPDHDDFTLEPAAELWHLDGEPRFAHLVKHPCRTCEGQELFDTIRAGWPHGDAEGTYVRWCLTAEPSFVCEVDGAPVCASSTHLSRTMGMIFTPEEHRGKGYASSLAAFQADEMLRRYGFATAHIWHDNYPSQALLKKMEFRKFPGYFTWIRLYLPEKTFVP